MSKFFHIRAVTNNTHVPNNTQERVKIEPPKEKEKKRHEFYKFYPN